MLQRCGKSAESAVSVYPKFRSVEVATGQKPLACEDVAVFYVSADLQDRVDAFVKAAGLEVRVEVDATLTGFSLKTSPQATVPTAVAQANGYVLEVDACAFTLLAHDAAGFYAGLQSLWQLLEGNVSVTSGHITDWPETKIRSFQIDVGRQPETLAELQRLLRQQARYHYNECQLYLENSIKLAVFGDAADPDGLSKDEYRELTAYGAALGIDVVPSLNLLGHMEKLLPHPAFKHLSETREGPRHQDQPFLFDICPELPEARIFVAEIIREICEISSSQKLMVGLDECWTIGSCPLCRAKLDEQGHAGAIFRDYIHFLHAEVSRYGKSMWMWDDMLFYHKNAIEDIPRDIGMNIWHYSTVEEYPAYSFQNWRRIDGIAELAERGHPIMLCGGTGTENLMSLMRYADGYDIDGLLATEWEGRARVQELRHLDRAFAASVFWHGNPGMPSDLAAALEDRECAGAAELDGLLTAIDCIPLAGGFAEKAESPRYWLLPGNAVIRRQQEQLLRLFDKYEVLPEAIEVQRAFLTANHVGVSLDYIREETALIGRRMLQRGWQGSAGLDRLVKTLQKVVALAESAQDSGRLYHERYAEQLSQRPMIQKFAQLPAAPRALLTALQAFQAAPSAATWPYPAASLCLDYLIVDRCAQRLQICISEDGDSFEELYSGPARAADKGGNHACQAFALPFIPRLVRLEIGGFAALGLRHVRLETINGTQLPKAVTETTGAVLNSPHLLEFNEKMALFNEPDVMKNWLSLEPLPANQVVLEFDLDLPAPERQY